jgi:isoleucyl-tRNA synthetase
MFQSVDTSVSFPRLEEDILEWWATNGVVEKALSAGERPFVFFEGPPTANGPPGFHHTISRIFKDVVLRYRSMQGYHIIGRREGWDTHGLPVEIQVEKELGFSGKPDIERYGIAAFNAKCKESVWRYIQDWKAFTRRIAYWISDDAYITYENTYIESLWWVFRQLWDRGLLFRDFKVTMHCPRCDTSLSDHEVSMGFRDDVDDPSVWVRFRVGDQAHPLADVLAGSSLVAWTTTPWTLPANVALCVQPEATYALVRRNDAATGQDERLVVASALVAQVLGEGAGAGTGAGTEAGEAPPVEIERTFTGSELVGLRYEPLFEGVPPEGETAETVDLASAYRVIADEFVSLEDGTGIVHIAPAYGDLEIGRKYGLPTLFSVALNGEMLPQFADLGFGGTFFKQADPIITRHLKERGLLLRSGRVRHSYPFCWRCDTPLLYYAKRSWYIRTTAMKPELIANNQRVFWVPEHLRDGRFGNWLEHNIDWAISRERYWGTPLPVWVSDDGQVIECIGSVAELEQKAGRSLQGLDLHRPWVDEVTWEAPDGHGTMRRIPDVADCWFDSGAMQVAQWHYPFENRELFDSAHPADYICEAVDQTRGWFYTLHAVSTLLFNKPSFLHVISLGHILDAEGRKMSKSLGNVVDPWAVFGRYGVDALRWNLFTASPPGNPRRFSEEQVGESLRQFLLTLWNTYAFFVTYANLDGWTPERQTGAEGGEEPARAPSPSPSPSLALIDRWALARLHALVRDVSASMEGYDVMSAARAIESFVDELSNWYVRRNRRRFWKSEADTDKQAAYHTLYTCLVMVTKLVAPFAPFISESLYRNLVGEGDPAAPESVHLSRWPDTDATLIDDRLVADMQVVMRVVSLGRAARKSSGVKVRQPLSEVWVRVATPGGVEGLRRFEDEVRDELNIKTVRYLDASTDFVEYQFKPNLRAVGKKYGKLVPALTAALREMGREEARAAAHAVEKSLPFSLVVAGQTCDLLPEEVLIETSSPEGYAVAEGDGTLVALNTSLTHELRLEGAARDLVRNVQDTRKSAGLAISDRIRLYLDAHDEGNGAGEPGAVRLQQVIAAWSDYVRAETLAVHLLAEPAPAGAYQETIELDGEQVTVGIVRCGEGEA